MSSSKIEVQLETPWTLMNPGPINLKDCVRLSLLSPELCHREVEFQTLLEQVRQKIASVFNIEEKYKIALLAGSGTAAVEAMIVSGMPPEGKLLIIENGVYGERINKIAQAAHIETIPYNLEWGEKVDFQFLEKIIKDNKDIKALAAIHHETTTGLVNDIEKIGKVCAQNDLLYFLDTVSGLAAEEIDIEKCNITIAASTANKGIHGVPGISFAVVAKDYLPQMDSYPVRSVYFHLSNYIKCQDSGTIPFTMPVHVMYAFNTALDELIAETVTGRIERFKKRANFVRDELDGNYELFLARDDYGNTMTSIKLPHNLNYKKIHQELKKDGIVIYAGQGGLVKSIFRIAHLGEYNDKVVLPKLMNKLVSLVKN
jgi:2-aminoethylphosphonate-pyruvate transaminase